MDERLARQIGSTARAARRRAKLTQADVAERLGIASEVYGRLERGAMLPKVVTLRNLALALGVPADQLLGLGEGRGPPPPLPEGGRAPEARRLKRRTDGLPARAVRLLGLVARELARGRRPGKR